MLLKKIRFTEDIGWEKWSQWWKEKIDAIEHKKLLQCLWLLKVQNFKKRQYLGI